MFRQQPADSSSIQDSIFITLPYEIMRRVVAHTRTLIVFRVCKYFASFMEDKKFWAYYTRKYIKQPFLRHYSDAPLTEFRFPPNPASWRSYLLLWTMNEAKRKLPKSLFFKTALKTVSLKVEPDMSETIARIKERLETETGMEAARQRLTFVGQQLDNSKTLKDYNIKHECTIQLS
jgi:hypothetical protein